MLQQEPGLELVTRVLLRCSAVQVAPEKTWVSPQIFVLCELGPRSKSFMEGLESKEDYFTPRDCAGAAVLGFAAAPLLVSNKKPLRTC